MSDNKKVGGMMPQLYHWGPRLCLSTLPPFECRPLDPRLSSHGGKVAAVSPGLKSTFRERESRMNEEQRAFPYCGFIVTFGKEHPSQGLLSLV